MHRLWPSAAGENILGVGFPLPYLRPYFSQAHRVIVAMPAAQGAFSWGDSSKKKNIVTLTMEDCLPFSDQSFHKILLVHHLEFASSPSAVLRECWRLLKPEGELLVCVPQKYRLWGLFGDTPFSQGETFSEKTLKQHLQTGLFSIDREEMALFFPPFLTHHPRLKRLMPFIEKQAPKWLAPLGGVLLVKARKQLYLPRRSYRTKPSPSFAECSF